MSYKASLKGITKGNFGRLMLKGTVLGVDIDIDRELALLPKGEPKGCPAQANLAGANSTGVTYHLL